LIQNISTNTNTSTNTKYELPITKWFTQIDSQLLINSGVMNGNDWIWVSKIIWPAVIEHTNYLDLINEFCWGSTNN
jgi:hypothetical protein